MDPFLYGERFLAKLDNPPVFEATFAEWLDELAKRPLWSAREPNGRRIPWRLAGTAFAEMKAQFRRPGVYMLAASPLIPRYIGETGSQSPERQLLEELLIETANTWNEAHGFLPLCNVKHQHREGKGTFESRLFKRYFTKGGASNAKILPQFLLAEAYEDEIKSKGISAFPSDLVKAYETSYRRSGRARFIGAVDSMPRHESAMRKRMLREAS